MIVVDEVELVVLVVEVVLVVDAVVEVVVEEVVEVVDEVVVLVCPVKINLTVPSRAMVRYAAESSVLPSGGVPDKVNTPL